MLHRLNPLGLTKSVAFSKNSLNAHGMSTIRSALSTISSTCAALESNLLFRVAA
jgi:hypothetical protein